MGSVNDSQGHFIKMRIFVLATLVGLGMRYPVETSKQHNHPSNQHDAGFMSGMDFDGFIQDARLPAMGRSADVAEDRQGGGGGAGFNAPGLNIPFTPNFQFNEFSSPFGNGNSFSTFLSGLGGQSQLATQGDFVAQTEQRFNRPQIGGGQFKRETPKKHKNSKNHQNPSHRYESAQYEQPKSNYKQQETFKRPAPVYTPKKRKTEQPRKTYQKYYSPEVRQDKQEPVYQKTFDQETRNQEFNIESRENVFEEDNFEDFVGKTQNMEKMFSQQENQFPETKFDMSFEPAKFDAIEKVESPKAKQPTFSPPALIEKFNKPIKHSESYPFQVPASKQESIPTYPFQAPAKKQEPYPFQAPTKKQEPYSFQAPAKKESYSFETPARKQEKVKPLNPSNVKSFTNVGENFNAQSENNFSPSSPLNSKPSPTFEPLPGFTNFKAEPKKEQKQPQPTKKPYKYEKKNFREPVKQVNRNSGPHQLIRIKAKRPQPKQLRQPNRPSQNQGFRPINHSQNSGFRTNPNPGKLVIEEVVRRNDPYKPSEIEYDNQQPLITLDSVSSGGKKFKASNNQDSFAVNVKASFSPKLEHQRQRVQKRHGLVHLPSLTLPSRPQKRQRSLLIDEVPYFESAKLTRPSSMDTAFVLDTDHFGF